MAATLFAEARHCPAHGQPATVPRMEADALLMARLCAGDDEALAEIIDRLGPAMYGAAARILGPTASAQDVVQEVLVELWTRPGRYDPSLGSLRTYLIVLARHRAVDHARGEIRRRARHERHQRLNPVVSPPTPSEQVASAAAASAVRDAVNQLPEGQRIVVELAYFQGMTFREVALAVGIPEGTAKSRLRLAFVKLEHLLDRHLLESP
jgi:RNA polymerase sigma-70 factor, ECF subfamily